MKKKILIETVGVLTNIVFYSTAIEGTNKHNTIMEEVFLEQKPPGCWINKVEITEDKDLAAGLRVYKYSESK